jgi:DNA-binding response OmpR family regulator
MSKSINISEWEEDFLFYITQHTPRYESLRELEKKLVRVIAFLNTLNKNNPNENKAGIEISKFAISYTDKLVEFFGFGEGNTPKPFNFDQALNIVFNILINVHQMNVDINYFVKQENEKCSEIEPHQVLDINKPQIKVIAVSSGSKIQLDESRLVISYKSKEVFLESKIKFKLFEILCVNHGQPVQYNFLFNIAWGKDPNSAFETTDKNNLSRTKGQLTKLLPKDLKIKIESTISGTYVMNFS